MDLKKLKISVLHSTVQKWLREIREDPKRGIEDLLELTALFSDSHQPLLDEVTAQLRDENSAYYRLVKRLALETDAEHLSSFGINLGYHSLHSGSKQIRKVEATGGFHVPWCLFLDAGGAKANLTPSALASLFSQGQKLGIGCYMIELAPSYPHFDQLLTCLQSADNCAFVLFLAPEMITAKTIVPIAQTQNLLVMLNLDKAELAPASQRLLRNGRLCGGFTRYTQKEHAVAAQMEPAIALGLPILMFLDATQSRPLGESAADLYWEALRKTPTSPIFPLDLYRDAAQIDRSISSFSACLVSIGANGTLCFHDERLGYHNTGRSILNSNLLSLLSVLPKR